MKEPQPCGTIQDAQRVDGHNATATALYAKPHQQGSPTCNPGLHHANVQLTRPTDHNCWPWHVPNLAMCPKKSYPLQLLKLHKSTATKAYLPLQHSQYLQHQPVQYQGTYSVHLAQRWFVHVRAQSAARILITTQANAPTHGLTMVKSSAIIN